MDLIKNSMVETQNDKAHSFLRLHPGDLFADHLLSLSVINPEKCYKVIYDKGGKKMNLECLAC